MTWKNEPARDGPIDIHFRDTAQGPNVTGGHETVRRVFTPMSRPSTHRAIPCMLRTVCADKKNDALDSCESLPGRKEMRTDVIILNDRTKARRVYEFNRGSIYSPCLPVVTCSVNGYNETKHSSQFGTT